MVVSGQRNTNKTKVKGLALNTAKIVCDVHKYTYTLYVEQARDKQDVQRMTAEYTTQRTALRYQTISRPVQ